MSISDELTEGLDKLAALGDKQHIAAYLQEQGILGVRKGVAQCPVAIYVRQYTECTWSIAGPKKIVVVGQNRTIVTQETPASVVEFIEAFDSGEFPELERKYPRQGILATFACMRDLKRS